MSNDALLTLYNLDKDGTKNSTTKKCRYCNTVNELNEKTCTKCGHKLSKTKMLNCDRNTTLANRFTETHDEHLHILKYFHLLSNGLELYETEVLELSIDTKNIKVIISNEKVFKSLSKSQELHNFTEKSVPGLLDYMNLAMYEQDHEYAIRNFTSLNASTIENLLYVHLNYRAIETDLIPSKVFYYGKQVNLKEYFPNVDFNKEEEVNKIILNRKLLGVWDIKNKKYIEKIIEFSKEDKIVQEILEDSIKQLETYVNNHWDKDYNYLIDIYGMLFNGDILLKDFIRLYQNSRNDNFAELKKLKTLYRRVYGKKIIWSEINKIEIKEINTLKMRVELMEKGLNKSEINVLYDKLNVNPRDALDYLIELSKERK